MVRLMELSKIALWNMWSWQPPSTALDLREGLHCIKDGWFLQALNFWSVTLSTSHETIVFSFLDMSAPAFKFEYSNFSYSAIIFYISTCAYLAFGKILFLLVGQSDATESSIFFVHTKLSQSDAPQILHLLRSFHWDQNDGRTWRVKDINILNTMAAQKPGFFLM